MPSWIVTDARFHEVLGALRETHTTVPLPAYGLDGRLLTPAEYGPKLEGALVEVEFYLEVFHSLGGDVCGMPLRDTVVATMRRLYILAPYDGFFPLVPVRTAVA